MENFSRIYSSIEEACQELDDAITGNPLKPRTTSESLKAKDEMIKTGMILLECKIRLWLLDKLLDGKITDREFLDLLEKELEALHNL